MNKKTKLSYLDPIGHELADNIILFDREEGRTVMVEDSLLSAVRSGESIDAEELPDWQKDAPALARAIAKDDGTRFIDPPEKDPRGEFKWCNDHDVEYEDNLHIERWRTTRKRTRRTSMSGARTSDG